MSHKREWIKFLSVVGIAVALAIAFLSVVDLPKRPLSAQQPQTEIFRQQKPAPVAAAQPVVDLGNAFAAVAEAVGPAVVYIYAEQTVARQSERQAHPQLPAPFDQFFGPDVQQRPRRGSGSGFLISSDGYVMTNNHVVEGFDRLSVMLHDRRTFQARVVGRDPDTDIAIIKIDGDNLPSVSLGDSDALRVGEWVLAIGTPLDSAFTFTVTAGIVSGRGRRLRLNTNQWAISDFIQTDAAINPGNSGGPLVNIKGQVIGINSAIASQTGLYAGYSFAIPVNLAKIVGDQLIRDGRVTRAALGVQVQDATDVDAEYVGLSEVRGVVVHDFSNDNSPAKRAGIEVGDVIVELDGERVDYVAQLQQVVGFKRPGETVNVTVMRAGGVRRTIPVRLAAAGADEPTEVASDDTRSQPEAPSYEAKLGVQVEELSREMLASDRRLGSEQQGPIITAIDPNGPARRAGLFVPDPSQGYLPIITHIDGTRVRTRAELAQALRGVSPGDVVSLQLFETVGDATRTRVVRYRAGGE